MNKYYQKLNIDVSNCLIDKQSLIDRVIGKTLHEVHVGNYIPRIINQSWLDYMQSLDLTVDSCVVFSKTSNANNVPRVDLATNDKEDKRVYSCDFALTGFCNTINWYDVPSEPPEKINSAEGANYLSWKIPYENAVEAYALDSNLTLVNVGEPHNIKCIDNEQVSISLRFKTKVTNWDEAVALFEPYIVNE